MVSEIHQPRLPHARRLLAICLGAILLSSLLASFIQNSWGRVRVMEIKLPMQNGQWIVADLYKPHAATKENPAPLVVVVPGFQRSKEALGNISIELSRRGLVVIAIDPYAQGGSSSSTSPRSATEEGYGLYAVIDYVAETSNLNYVDKTRLAATGHSAGGNAAILAAAHFGREAGGQGPSKLHSVFVSGYVLSFTKKVLRDVRSNVGTSYALYDEGAYRNELGHGDLTSAPEALRILQLSSPHLAGETVVQMGHYYGDVATRTLRVIFNERTIHPIQPYLPEAVANQLAFFERALDWKSPIGHWNQVWYWKEILTLISLVAAFVSLVPLASLLLARVPYFRTIVHPLPPALPQPRGRGKILFWSLLALGALIACFTYIPMTELSQKLFVAASSREQTWFFPQRMNNGVMLWAVLNGLVGFLIFFLTHHFHGKKNGLTPEYWGLQTSWPELKITAVLAITLFLTFFLFLFIIYYFFHVDYRFIFLGVRKFQPVLLLFLLIYAPFFLIFFLSNSLRVNGSLRLEGQPPWQSMLLAGVANSLGLFFIVLVQYVALAVTGTVFWTDGWLYINLLFAVVPIMFVLPYFHRYFFLLTGRIYLGPMTMCPIFIMILVSNTVCYIPL